MRKFKFGDHTMVDKSFDFSNGVVSMDVDYDDVNHAEVDAGIELMTEILNEHWNDEEFKRRYKDKVIEQWYKYERGHSDFENMEEYLLNYGIKQ